jgi:hypothetical protein
LGLFLSLFLATGLVGVLGSGPSALAEGTDRAVGGGALGSRPVLSCRVSSGPLETTYYGYPIVWRDAVVAALAAKGYSWVGEAETGGGGAAGENAEFRLEMGVSTELRGRFHHALATAEFRPLASGVQLGLPIRLRQSKLCWGQLCAVSDFRPPLVRVLRELREKLPQCQLAP